MSNFWLKKTVNILPWGAKSCVLIKNDNQPLHFIGWEKKLNRHLHFLFFKSVYQINICTTCSETKNQTKSFIQKSSPDTVSSLRIKLYCLFERDKCLFLTERCYGNLGNSYSAATLKIASCLVVFHEFIPSYLILNLTTVWIICMQEVSCTCPPSCFIRGCSSLKRS